MIRVQALCKSFASHKAVDQLSFEVKPGDILGFLGPNGAGKSTTMKMLTGFLTQDSGVIEINDAQYPLKANEIQAQLGYLPEGAPLYDEMTVYQFLRFIAQARGIPKTLREGAISSVVNKLSLQDVLNKTIDTLSKGFKRRVGIAQAIIHDPAILILDEPTDGLDPNQKQQIRALIKGLARDKIVIVSTHILEEVSAICNRVMIIAKGKKRFDGSPEELLSRSRMHNAVVLKMRTLADISGILEIDGVADMEHDRDANQITVFAKDGCSIIEDISQLIVQRQLPVHSFYQKTGQFDEVFRALTQDKQRKQA